MTRFICLAIAVLIWTSFASAEPVESTSSISLKTESVEHINEENRKDIIRQVWHQENSISIVKMNAFDRRISDQAQRATSSICNGCFVSQGIIKVSLLHRIVNPASNEMKIDDPAQAPID